MNKSTGLFWIFFIPLLFVNSTIYFSIDSRFNTWNSPFTIIITLLLFFIAIIPLTTYLSEKLVKYSLSKGLEKDRNYKIFVSIFVVVPITLLSIIIVNDHREKGLDEVISFNSTKFTSFEFESNPYDSWKTDEQEPVEELIGFLSQYRVKKMKDAEWDSNVSKEKGFRITIFSKDEVMFAYIYENRALFLKGGYYNVVNGPIDMEWVEKYASGK